jgi:hypothetical protein
MTSARPTVGPDAGSATAATGFRPASRRRSRIAAGVALAAIAIGGNLYLYSNLDASEPVVQAVRDIPAGEQLTADMFRTVDVEADSTVNLVAGDRIGSLVGSYAKVRVVAGSLVTADALQATPLVTPGTSIVAIRVADGSLPIGLRERVPVQLVVAADRADGAGTTSIAGRVVGLPSDTSSALGMRRCRSRSPPARRQSSRRPTTCGWYCWNRPRTLQRTAAVGDSGAADGGGP